jgi:recombination protein RecA
MIGADNQQATAKAEVLRDYQPERRASGAPYDIVRSSWRHEGCAKARRPKKLNKTQGSILVGLLLGDGHLEAVTRDRTCRLKVEHSLKQKGYVDWLYGELSDFIRNEPYTKMKSVHKKQFSCYGFTTCSSELFQFYAEQFYVERKKIIPKLFAKLIDPLALAIWFMDDGSFKSNHHRTYIIHSVGYTKKDLIIVQKVLKEKFGIKIALHKQYERWRIYFLSETADKFRTLIEPYMIPSMKYKLGLTQLPKE